MASFTNAGAFKTVQPASIPAFLAAGAQLYDLAPSNFPFAYSYAKLTAAEIVISMPSQPCCFPYTLSNFPTRHLPLTHREMGATSQRIRMRGVNIYILDRCCYYCWEHSYNTDDLVDQSTCSAMAEVVEKESW